MTVKKLIKLLEDLPEGALVVQSRDYEGNGFSPVARLSTDRYVSHSNWGGELVEDESEGVVAAVLWPTN